MGELLSYKNEVNKAMRLLGEDPRTIFIGQTVACSGSSMYDSLSGVSMEKRIEFPVAEDMQMGMAIGLSLMGYIPITIYPRFDFLLLAVNQLVNHLDKCEEMTHGQFKPKVIIRTMVGSKEPLYPGVQHCQDYTSAFRHLLQNIEVIQLYKPENIVNHYKCALENGGNHLFVEYANLYNGGS